MPRLISLIGTKEDAVGVGDCESCVLHSLLLLSLVKIHRRTNVHCLSSHFFWSLSESWTAQETMLSPRTVEESGS